MLPAVASLASLEPIGKIGRYDVIGRLASGGMAEIFLGRESGAAGGARHLVLKRILPHAASDERMVEMFVHEARLCMNLKHPHICPIYEFGRDDDSFFLAMEWVRGVSLRELTDRVGGPLPTPFAVKVFADVADALQHAHTCTDETGEPLSIVHRDVNPENIMIGFDGVVKLLDFGVAKAATGRKHQTEAGNLKGKFAYISPEQYQGEALDGRSDVFSLGVSLYETVTGESLYDRASEYETVAAIVLDPDIPSVRATNPDVPPELDVIVQMALAKNRDERYASADAMQMALTTFAAREGYHTRSADISATLRRLVPDLVDAEPNLDRRPASITGGWPAQAKDEVAAPTSRERTSSQQMERLLLAAEADEDLEELMAKRGGTRWRAIASAVIILVSLGIVAWVVAGPRGADAEDPSEGVEESGVEESDVEESGVEITDEPETPAP